MARCVRGSGAASSARRAPAAPATARAPALQCPAAEVAAWSAGGQCADTGARNTTSRSCAALGGPAGVVAGRAVAGADADAGAGAGAGAGAASTGGSVGDGLLCVVTDNRPAGAGAFFIDPGTRAAASVDWVRPLSGGGGGSYAAAARLPQGAGAAATYAVAATVPAAAASGGGAWSGGRLALPRGSAGGPCALVTVGYRRDIAPATCWRRVPADASGCAALAATALSTGVLLGSSPRAAAASAPAGYIAVALGTMRMWNASAGGGAAAVVSGGGGSPPAPEGDAGSCTCASALIGLALRLLTPAGGGALSGAAADVVLADISLGAGGCAAGSAWLAAPLTSTAAWLPDAAAAAALAAAAPPRAAPAARSGWPGYVAGAPVLAGVLVTASGGAAPAAAGDRQALARAPPASPAGALAANTTLGGGLAGLALRGGDAAGACVPAPPAGAADGAAPVPVAFGEAMLAGCALTLTRAALAALCAAPPASTAAAYAGLAGIDVLAAPSGAPARLAPSHVGAVGGADQLAAWNWVRLEAPASPPPPPTFDAAAGTCAGLATGILLQLAAADIGQVGAPQRRIVAARWAWATDTWTWAAGDSPAATQTFAMRSAVAWTQVPSGTVGYEPTPPPVKPVLPADLWFPFAASA